MKRTNNVENPLVTLVNIYKCFLCTLWASSTVSVVFVANAQLNLFHSIDKSNEGLIWQRHTHLSAGWIKHRLINTLSCAVYQLLNCLCGLTMTSPADRNWGATGNRSTQRYIQLDMRNSRLMTSCVCVDSFRCFSSVSVCIAFGCQ